MYTKRMEFFSLFCERLAGGGQVNKRKQRKSEWKLKEKRKNVFRHTLPNKAENVVNGFSLNKFNFIESKQKQEPWAVESFSWKSAPSMKSKFSAFNWLTMDTKILSQSKSSDTAFHEHLQFEFFLHFPLCFWHSANSSNRSRITKMLSTVGWGRRKEKYWKCQRKYFHFTFCLSCRLKHAMNCDVEEASSWLDEVLSLS